MTNRHIHQEIDFVCVLCGADLKPPAAAPSSINVMVEEDIQIDEKVS